MSAAAVGKSWSASEAAKRKLRLVGDGPNRRADDFYATPPEATRALLAVERFEGELLEPACGDGAISRVLQAAGYQVRSTDLVDRGFGEGGQDFLWPAYPYTAPNIVTNPPFKLATPFVEAALDRTSCKVAMLLKLAFLETRERADLFARTPLARVWVFSRRLTFRIPERSDHGNGMLAFAWFVWDRAHDGSPRLGWLP